MHVVEKEVKMLAAPAYATNTVVHSPRPDSTCMLLEQCCAFSVDVAEWPITL